MPNQRSEEPITEPEFIPTPVEDEEDYEFNDDEDWDEEDD